MEKIDLFEEKGDWRAAIQLLQSSENQKLDVYLRVMFILVDFLVEAQYSIDEYNFISNQLKKIYHQAEEKYFDDGEFLFFSAIMIYIGEWYFGMDSIDTANIMLEKAMIIEPNNILYKWGYYSRIDQRSEKNTDLKLQLSEILLFKDESQLGCLVSKGLLGKYVLGTLENTYEHLNAIKDSHRSA